MSKPVPPVSKYMTTCPETVAPDARVVDAHQMMQKHGFRHLPVVDRGALVGLLSERDIALLLSIGGVEPANLRVTDAMTPRPFSVAPDSLLDEVSAEMAERKIGSAVVVDNNAVVGIFTATDALAALTVLLRTRLAKA